jgi:2-amino-4-hydroxy-6-hydroxymethyldihydropteridine diphosphokinase
LKHKAFIALGSNLAGDLDCPASQVIRGFQRISLMPKTALIKASSLYKTAPIGYSAEQLKNVPDFINAVVEISTDLGPLDLLDAILTIENEAGRQRPFANAPRILDCDLLLFDDIEMHSKKLTLPHPRMLERAFVLLPLAEISPKLTLKNHVNVVKLADKFKNQGIQKIENSDF